MSDDQKQTNQHDTNTQNNQTQEVDIIGGITCPIDPYEREMCESCQ